MVPDGVKEIEKDSKRILGKILNEIIRIVGHVL